MSCKHCRNGFLENRFGQDVECVNGILIDIDVAHEGWQRDVVYPVAPCHPMWERQQSGDEDFPNDCQERLQAWCDVGTEQVVFESALIPSEPHDEEVRQKPNRGDPSIFDDAEGRN